MDVIPGTSSAILIGNHRLFHRIPENTSIKPQDVGSPNERWSMSSTPVALMAQGLTKSYGNFQALRGVNLEVQRGEIFGFLGPNGAGKTTTIRCLLDLVRPSGGTLRVLGLNPQVDSVAVRANTGYLPGDLRLDGQSSVETVLRDL